MAYVDPWMDNWIPRDYLLRPITLNIHELGLVVVSCLINTTTNLGMRIFYDGCCGRRMLTLFDSHCFPHIPDLRVWHYTKHGFYLLKLSYHLARRIRQQATVSVWGQQ